MSAAVAYYRDIATVMEAQRKAAPTQGLASSGGGAQHQQQESGGQPSKGRFPMRGGAAPKAMVAAKPEG